MNKVVNNYNIHYIDEGAGEIVLLLHGWGSNLKCFASLIDLLKHKYRVIALDLPGFGESSGLDKSFRIDDYADFIIEFIKSICPNEEKIILVGHSYGGRIIIKLNSRNSLPFTIDKNILIDAAGIKDKRDLKVAYKVKVYKALKAIINMLPFKETQKTELIDKLKSRFGSSDYQKADKVMRETLINAVNEDLTDLLKNMKETLLIWGDQDTATPLFMGKLMEKEIKNAGLVVLKGCGHFSFIDDTYTFLKVISSYLKI